MAMKKKLPVLAELLLCFMKIGLFTFGGGYAMISLIHQTCVDEKRWMGEDEMMNMTVIAESTPGPIAINCATYVGYKMAGFPGAFAATLGMVIPSFAIIYAISMFFDRFLEIALIAKAFKGIKIGVGILILRTGLNMLQKMSKKPQPRIIAGFAFGAILLINIFSLKISTITLMLAAAAVSLGIFALKGGAAK